MENNWLAVRVVELTVTYLAHSTLFLGAAWLSLRVVDTYRSRRDRAPSESPALPFHPSVVDRLWKWSAILALATAPLSVLSGQSQPTWEWSWSELPESQIVEASEAVSPGGAVEVDMPPATESVSRNHRPLGEMSMALDDAAHPNPAASVVPFIEVDSQVEDSDETALRISTAIGEMTSPITSDRIENDVPSPVVSAALIESPMNSIRDASPYQRPGQLFGFALLLWYSATGSWLLVRCLWLHRHLARYTPIEGSLRREVDRLHPQGRTIRLLRAGARPHPSASVCRSQDEPFACGVFRWTIVIPEWVERDLSPAEMKALLAHEVAHLVRRDPLWQWLGEMLCTCFAFQPLNFVARRGWRQVAELLCDDWAVERQVPATTLASSLAQIAEGRLERGAGLMGLTAVGRVGSLTSRINWLLRSERRTEPKRTRFRMLVPLLTFSAGCLVGTYGPRLSLVTSLEAASVGDASAVWSEIQYDMRETRNELALIESRLADDVDSSLAKSAAQLRERVTLLHEELSQSRLAPPHRVGATQSSTKGIR